MREISDLGPEASTLVAVGVGAVLATIGGFLATMYEARLHRSERQRTAALTLAEILNSLRLLIRAMESAHGIGDPWGPVTTRLARTARREIDAYERSRPALSDLRDTDLRLMLHAVVIRITIALDDLLDSTADDEREANYEYLREVSVGLDDLVHRLVPIAGQPINPYDALSHHPTDLRPKAP
jgi:hypothetical protein